ncbi:Beta-1,3-galactosyltransferase 6 [Stylophora pistillata]|uniref:Hexosyltransferase n=2 Tax=Stylophora pistillata TaxID=50429 RepID=A0A2B4RP74_STYPI|nr:Beta-1,3-galactosyltransferase 6 [Stylophora pistillata]
MVRAAYDKISSLVHIPTQERILFLRGSLDENKTDKFARMEEGKIFRKENQTYFIKRKDKKTRLKLIVAILSAPIRFDRREGIRRTWMNQCSSEEVVCRFFTDSLSDMEPNVRSVLVNESAKYGDLEFMPVPKGYNFGLRLLWLMEWSVERYEFDFFLRMDDDYFVCLKRLLFEIPFRPQKRLYWGYVHCEVEGLVRIDEGFLLLSGDLVLEFTSKRDKLLCHPFGDQTIAIWINDVQDVIFFHDPRIFHDVSAKVPEFKSLSKMCLKYISLHGSYLHEMLIYWETSSKENHSTYWVPSIQPISNLCPLSTHFDWRAMGGPPYGYEPKPCVLKPLWDIGSMHRGRNMM